MVAYAACSDLNAVNPIQNNGKKRTIAAHQPMPVKIHVVARELVTLMRSFQILYRDRHQERCHEVRQDHCQDPAGRGDANVKLLQAQRKVPGTLN